MKKLLIVLLLILTGCTSSNGDLYRYEFISDQYLDTVTKVLIYHEKGYDVEGLEEGILSILEETHQIYDSHTPGTELSNLNDTAHIEPFMASDELYAVVKRAIEVAEESNGAYDPTITPLTTLWAIDDDSKWSTRVSIPTDEEISAALEFVDYTKVELNDSDKSVFFTKEGITLDLGGISKGYITLLLRDYIIENGIESAIINVGQSSQLPIGTRSAEKEANEEEVIYEITEEAWRIGTSDPYDLFGFSAPVGAFPLQDMALSSSGSSQRYFMFEEERYHHIFDTETGYPADNELILIQVKSTDIIGIDAISTMLYVMGLDAAMEYVESTDEMEALFVTYDKEVFFSSGFGTFTVYSEEYTIK